jgi:hypothetical protein
MNVILPTYNSARLRALHSGHEGTIFVSLKTVVGYEASVGSFVMSTDARDSILSRIMCKLVPAKPEPSLLDG